jgi:hypothetical protein
MPFPPARAVPPPPPLPVQAPPAPIVEKEGPSLEPALEASKPGGALAAPETEEKPMAPPPPPASPPDGSLVSLMNQQFDQAGIPEQIFLKADEGLGTSAATIETIVNVPAIEGHEKVRLIEDLLAHLNALEKAQASEAIAEPTELTADPAELLAEPAEPTAEPAEFLADPTEFTADPAEFLADPAELTAEPAEPTAEPAEFLAEPAEFLAEPAEFLADPAEFLADPAKLLADPAEFLADPAKLTADPAEFLADPAELLADPAELLADPAELTADPAELTADPAELTAEPTELTADPTELTADPTELTAEPAELAADPTELTADPTELTADPTEVIAEPIDYEWAAIEASLPDADALRSLNGEGEGEATGADSQDVRQWEENAPEHFHRFEQQPPLQEISASTSSTDEDAPPIKLDARDEIAAASAMGQREEDPSFAPIFIPPPARSARDTPLVPPPGPDAPLLSEDDIAASLEPVAQPPNIWMQPPPDVVVRPPAPWPPRAVPPPPPILPIRLDAPAVARPAVLPPPVFIESPQPGAELPAPAIASFVPVSAPEQPPSAPEAPEAPPAPLDLTAACQTLAVDPQAGLAGIASALARQPGMLGCIVRVRQETASAGEIPPAMAGSALDAAAAFLKGLRSADAIQHITAFGGNYASSFFASGGATICAIHRTRTFMPGVREKFAAAAGALAAA